MTHIYNTQYISGRETVSSSFTYSNMKYQASITFSTLFAFISHFFKGFLEHFVARLKDFQDAFESRIISSQTSPESAVTF